MSDVLAFYREEAQQVTTLVGHLVDISWALDQQQSEYMLTFAVTRPPDTRAVMPGDDITLVVAGQPYKSDVPRETLTQTPTRDGEAFTGQVCWNCDARIKDDEFAHEEDGMVIHDNCDDPRQEVWT